MKNLIQERRRFSDKRLTQFCRGISRIPLLNRDKDLCIYVTGSFGRCEASPHSDVDLFFVKLGSSKKPISRLVKTQIDSALIQAADRMGFPPFSRDGEFLTPHYLDDILKVMGSPGDDYSNCFTARMLLLLESRSVFNERVYIEVIRKLVAAYFRDESGHERDFRPVFLVNDILRYWKTLCLNYECRRNEPEDREEKWKIPNQIKNLKLKFSRMMTCFSTIAFLASHANVTQQQVLELIQLPPLERLKKAAARSKKGLGHVDELAEAYTWFLSCVGREDKIVRRWMAKEKDAAFKKADEFGSSMFKLLQDSADERLLRYLLI
jgi:hypothetical protein